MARVVVIGAGVGGLAAGLRLARAGHAVTVCEGASTVGGKLGEYVRDGFRFDTGPSLLTWPQTLADTLGAREFEALGVVGVDPAFHYRFADGTVLTVPDGPPERVVAAIRDGFGADAAADWASFLAHAGRVWDVVRGPFLTDPLAGPADLLRLGSRGRDLALVAPWATLRGIGGRHLRDPRLRLLLDRYATYSGSDPRRAPAALAVVPWLEQTHGAWYVPGGLRRIADALLTAARAGGVEVLLDTPVRRVLVEGGRATGVALADRVVSADVVVCNADAARLYGEFLTEPPREPLRRLRRAVPSLSGFVLLLALDGAVPAPAHHTVLFPADYDDEFDSVFGTRGPFGTRRRAARPTPDPAIYVTDPPDAAPDGHRAWFVLVNAPRHGTGPGCVDWDAPGLADTYADRTLDLLAARGLDVRDRVRWRVVRTPADLERDTGAPGGSIYGTSSNGPSAAFLRAANRSPVRGLYLVGGSAHPGGGLPLVLRSAAIVERLVGPA